MNFAFQGCQILAIRVAKFWLSGLPYLRRGSIDDFLIGVILWSRILKYGNNSQKASEHNMKTFPLQASCVPLPVRMSYVIKFPTHTKNTPSSFWISLLSDSATKVWSWITRVGGRMSVLLRSWGRDEISSEPKSVTYDWIINFPTYHTAWSISTKSVLQSTEASPGIPQMLLRWHKTYSNGWVVYRQRDTDL